MDDDWGLHGLEAFRWTKINLPRLYRVKISFYLVGRYYKCLSAKLVVWRPYLHCDWWRLFGQATLGRNDRTHGTNIKYINEIEEYFLDILGSYLDVQRGGSVLHPLMCCKWGSNSARNNDVCWAKWGAAWLCTYRLIRGRYLHLRMARYAKCSCLKIWKHPWFGILLENMIQGLEIIL